MDGCGFWVFWVELEMEEELIMVVVVCIVCFYVVVEQECFFVGRFEEW